MPIAPGIHNEWVRAWVVFTRSAARYPWNLFCGEMTHCWVMWSRFYPPDRLDAHEVTLKAEHTPGGLYCDVAFLPPAQIVQAIIEQGAIDVLRANVLVQRNRMRYFGSLNCVTAVKAVLNIDAPWCLTPTQLHRRLLHMGATSEME